jgi:hypothetical protein
MKTKREIIQETADFYGADPTRRATDALGACEITSSNGSHCAYGRCLLAKYQEEWKGCAGPDLSWDHKDECLLPEYGGHEGSFWQHLQNFHDNPENWTATGLSNVGQLKLAELLETYA